MSLIIKPLGPELIDDFLFFFDNLAFSDNPDWAKCYCHFYHFNGTGKKFQKKTAEQNRNASKQLILLNHMYGFLAYKDDDKPIGWCNANVKENFSKSMLGKKIVNSSGGKIASIVCFIIAPGNRRQGIARQLLKAAYSDFSSKNYDYLEAYPRKGDLTDAMHYHGPLSLYESEGFSIHQEFKDYYIVRKSL